LNTNTLTPIGLEVNKIVRLDENKFGYENSTPERNELTNAKEPTTDFYFQ
jgi:hypothetical protein